MLLFNLKYSWNVLEKSSKYISKSLKFYLYYYVKVYIFKIPFKKITFNFFWKNPLLLKNYLKTDFGYFSLLDWFQIYSHVAMIYYEGCYFSRSKIFNINLKYEILNNGCNCFSIY